MPSAGPTNSEVAAFLIRLSELMQLNGDNTFRIRALTNGAEMIEELEIDAVEMSRRGTLTDIEGVGKGIAELVTEFVDTGTAQAYEDLKKVVPEGLLDLLRLPGLGHKKVMAIHQALKITSIEELEVACRSGQLDSLPGFGGKTTQRLLESIDRRK